MDRYILDTDTCIYWLKGDKNIERNIIEKGLENIFITIITECELFYGAFKSTKKEKNLTVVEELKRKIQVLHPREEVSYYYGKIKSDLEAKGEALDDADILIASIALSNDATLVTDNIEQFKKIQGLKIMNWKTGGGE